MHNGRTNLQDLTFTGRGRGPSDLVSQVYMINCLKHYSKAQALSGSLSGKTGLHTYIHESFICYCPSADVELQLKLTNCRVATDLEIREKSGKVKRG